MQLVLNSSSDDDDDDFVLSITHVPWMQMRQIAAKQNIMVF
jgi:hypothetical protein